MSPASPNPGTTAAGCLVGFGASVMLVILLLFTRSGVVLMLAGLIQLVYIIPLVLHFRKKGESRTVTGLIISASMFFLLTAACASFLR